MTDDGDIFRAIKLGHPDHVIATSCGITTSTLEQKKKEFEEIKKLQKEGKTFENAAVLLMKDRGLVWYAYHILETANKELEQETLAEKRDGKPRLKPPPPEREKPQPEQPAQEEEEKTETKPKKKEKKERDLRKEHVDKTLQKTAETPAAEVLVDDAGNIGRELAIKRQDLGKHVMEATATAMMQFGYKDTIGFFNTIFQFFLDNYGIVQEKDAKIIDLLEANQKLQATMDEDIVKLFIAKSIDRFATSAHLGKIRVSLEDIEAYKGMLIDFFKSSILGAIELGSDEIARYRKLVDDIIAANTLQKEG